MESEWPTAEFVVVQYMILTDFNISLVFSEVA